MRRILCASLIALAACSNGKTPEPPSSINPALGAIPAAKCAPLADSIPPNMPRASLSLSVPNARPQPPRIPAGVRAGAVLHATFLVRPTGAADTASFTITGTTDEAYRRQLIQTMMGMHFTTPTIDGCPLWGRGDFQQVGIPR